MKKYIFIIVLFFNSSFLFSQKMNQSNYSDSLKLYNSFIEKGNLFYNNSDFSKAIEFFEMAFNINKVDFELNYKLGISYYNLYKPQKSFIFFETAQNLDSNLRKNELIKYIAFSLHESYKFDEAMFFYNKYLQNSLDSIENIYISKQIEYCKNGKTIISDTLDYDIINLGSNLNSEFDEYGLFYLKDSNLAIFTSKRPTNLGGFINPYDGDYYEDVFFGSIKDDTISSSYNPLYEVNTQNPDACIGISDVENAFFIFSDLNNGDIFYVQFDTLKMKWKAPTNLTFLNSEFTEKSICVIGDFEHIYFVSNRNESNGGSDIFYIYKNSDSTFSEYFNLGDNINTDFDEDFVYVNKTNDTMYFSSKGHNSMGEFDVFISTKDSLGNWQKAENLDFPINSPYDDIFFRPYKNYFTFSSIRDNGFGKMDIYKICKTAPKKPNKTIYSKNTLHFLDNNTFNSVAVDLKITNYNQTVTLYNLSIDSSGIFIFDYPINDTLIIDFSVENYYSKKDTLILDNEIIEKQYLILQNPSVFINSFAIYYENNEYQIDEKYYEGLDTLINILKEFPHLKIQISGHTDNTGSILYNNKLSEKRANEVFEYLLDNNITTEQIIFVGYGSSASVTQNKTKTEQALNRRTQFKIINYNY